MPKIPKEPDMKEQGPLPRLRIIFHYGSHESYEDARHVPEILRRYQPHFFADEDSYATKESYQELKETFQRLKKTLAQMTPLQREIFIRHFRYESSDPFLFATGVAIAETGIPLLPQEQWSKEASNKGIKEYALAEKEYVEAVRHFLSGDLDAALGATQNGMQTYTRANHHRDQHIASRIKNDLLNEIIPVVGLFRFKPYFLGQPKTFSSTSS